MRFPKSIKYVKIPWQQVLAILILLLAFVFFRSERKEMMQIIPSNQSAAFFVINRFRDYSSLYFAASCNVYHKFQSSWFTS